MAKPHDVLAQLLSESQADVLAAIGDSTWQSITRVLSAVMDAAPALDAIDGSLVMPEEISGNYTARHLAVPVQLTTMSDQEAMAYVTFPAESLAAFFDVNTNDAADEEQQLLVVGGTIAAQVIQALNTTVFSTAADGLALIAGETTANTMVDTLDLMDEPALFLQVAFAGAALECSVILPGTFLDIMAVANMPASTAADSALRFTLTAEEIDAAELVELPVAQPRQYASELVGAGVGATATPSMAGARNQQDESSLFPNASAIPGAGQLPPRPPTPITEAPTAQRARFAPLPENDPPAFRGNMDLLSSLQMNVTVELGRTQLTVAEVLALGSGSVIELDRLAGEPVDILVNDRIIARGEVVVVDENFGVRVVEVLRRGNENEERAS